MVLIPKYCARYPGQKAAVDKEHAKLEKEKETLVTIYNKISARVQVQSDFFGVMLLLNRC